jgi:predicted amino acid-binding ACT domain protein
MMEARIDITKIMWRSILQDLAGRVTVLAAMVAVLAWAMLALNLADVDDSMFHNWLTAMLIVQLVLMGVVTGVLRGIGQSK